MIKSFDIKKTYLIYNALQFKKVFKIKEKIKINECDEDYIMKHLSVSKKIYIVNFISDNRDDSYNEYWKIEEM